MILGTTRTNHVESAHLACVYETLHPRVIELPINAADSLQQ